MIFSACSASDEDEESTLQKTPKRTLMDVFRAEISHPKRKSLLHVTNLKEYTHQYKANKETATEYLHYPKFQVII